MDALIGWPGGDWQSTAWMAGRTVIAYLALVWAASVLWAYRDIRSRTRDAFSQVVALLLVTLFPLIGLPLYMVLRPRETMQQAYDRQLEQEAILSDLHSASSCPNCRRPVQDDFMVCAYCRTSLKHPCTNCGRVLNQAWRHCPFCSTTRATERSAGRLEFDAAADGAATDGAEPAAPSRPRSAGRGGDPTSEREPAPPAPGASSTAAE